MGELSLTIPNMTMTSPYKSCPKRGMKSQDDVHQSSNPVTSSRDVSIHQDLPGPTTLQVEAFLTSLHASGLLQTGGAATTAVVTDGRTQMLGAGGQLMSAVWGDTVTLVGIVPRKRDSDSLV